MSSRSARIVRGSVAALISTFLAAFSHVVAGGGGPGAVGLTLALTFSVLVCIALTGKTLSRLRLGLAVILSQLMFHALFTVGGTISPPAALSGPHVMSAMHGMDHGLAALLATTGNLSATSPMAPLLSWMFLAHVLAAVSTIVVLRRGEKAFWGLASWALIQIRVAARLSAPGPVLLSGPHRAAVESEPAFLVGLGTFRRSIRRRGPPATLFCV